MPMATPELAAKFEDDGEAWEVLKAAGWEHVHGVLIPPKSGYLPMPEGREADALDYLVDEWDWAVMPDDVRATVATGP